MQQQTIYEVAVIPIGSLNSIRQKETVYTYFSNLHKCIEQVSAALVLNGWQNPINYSAVYRALKAKAKYSATFEVAGNKVFRITILPKIINPTLPILGIEEAVRF